MIKLGQFKNKHTLHLKLTFFVLAYLMIFIPNAKCQVSGYQGKHVIIKTDLGALYPEKGYSIALEAAVFRNISLEIEYRRSNREYEQNFTIKNDYFEFRDIIDDLSEEKALTNENSIHLGIKAFLNSAYTAPRGPYIYLKYGMGRMNVEGQDIQTVYRDTLFGTPLPTNLVIDYSGENIRTHHFQIGFGISYIVAKRIFLDFGWGLHKTFINTQGHIEEPLVHNFIYKYGPQAIGGFEDLAGESRRLGGLGLSFRIAIGVLVF